MTRAPYWTFRTGEGVWMIARRGKKWCPMFGDENLGGYQSPHTALEALVGGHTVWPSCGDPAVFGLPDDLEDWDQH